nr:unnamed protein product [Callosobruchus analis]
MNGTVNVDDDQRNLGTPHMAPPPLIPVGYHWDCSDWARHSQTLPNITEVPGSEVPDSSSYHSNESNESRCQHQRPPQSHRGRHKRQQPHSDREQEAGYISENGLNALDSSGTEQEYRFTTGGILGNGFMSLPIYHKNKSQRYKESIT